MSYKTYSNGTTVRQRVITSECDLCQLCALLSPLCCVFGLEAQQWPSQKGEHFLLPHPGRHPAWLNSLWTVVIVPLFKERHILIGKGKY